MAWKLYLYSFICWFICLTSLTTKTAGCRSMFCISCNAVENVIVASLYSKKSDLWKLKSFCYLLKNKATNRHQIRGPSYLVITPYQLKPRRFKNITEYRNWSQNVKILFIKEESAFLEDVVFDYYCFTPLTTLFQEINKSLVVYMPHYPLYPAYIICLMYFSYFLNWYTKAFPDRILGKVPCRLVHIFLALF